MNDKDYCLWLSSITELELSDKFKLLSFLKSPYEIFHVNLKVLEQVPVSEKVKTVIIKSRSDFSPDKIYDLLYKKETNYISMYDKEYPEKLENIYNKPFGLFYKGSLPDSNIPSVSIIGARKCSEYGKIIAEKFSKELTSKGVQILSGLAYGIDGFSQRACIDNGGKTYGFLGTGPDICYPASNYDLYNRIIDNNGGIISEYFPGTKGLKNHFPERNRLISAFSDCLLVVEAKRKSGTMITVDNALEQGREVFIIPGRIGDVLSEGCMEMAKQGAHIALSSEEIYDFLAEKFDLNLFEDDDSQFVFKFNKFNKFSDNNNNYQKILLEKEEIILYSFLSFNPIHIDELIDKSGLNYMEVIKFLSDLREKDMITESTPGYFIKK